MANFRHYRIYCETQGQWVDTWADTPPTVCPVNPAHTVRSGSAAQFQTKLIVVVPEVDGQGILGGDVGVGDEMERVIGPARIEKTTTQAVPALYIQCGSGHPAGYAGLSIGMDANAPVLNIASAATGYPLVALQAQNSNARGDIAFGTSRVADPATPSEGDFWYDAGAHVLKYRDNAVIQSLVPASQTSWNRDGGGHIYAKTATDDLYIGGATPNGVWFDDGDMVLGGSSMVGTEKLLVVGSQLIDQNGNAVGLDIDSEATGAPLINLQPLNTNTRGDIAFGTARTADPSTPSQGDLWYESTSQELKFRKSASTVEVRNAIKLQGYSVAATAPTNQYLLTWSSGSSQWYPESVANLPGPYSSIQTATASTTTTSATDALISGMTVTPPAGKYEVFFSTSLQESNNNQTVFVSIYSGGTKLADSDRCAQVAQWNNVCVPMSTHALVTVDGAQAIEARWRVTGGTGTSLQRSLMIVRVS
jgi:hypothetical protein